MVSESPGRGEEDGTPDLTANYSDSSMKVQAHYQDKEVMTCLFRLSVVATSTQSTCAFTVLIMHT